MSASPLRFLSLTFLGDNNLSCYMQGSTHDDTSSVVRELARRAQHFHGVSFPMLVSVVDDDTGQQLDLFAESHPTHNGCFSVVITSDGAQDDV